MAHDPERNYQGQPKAIPRFLELRSSKGFILATVCVAIFTVRTSSRGHRQGRIVIYPMLNFVGCFSLRRRKSIPTSTPNFPRPPDGYYEALSRAKLLEASGLRMIYRDNQEIDELYRSSRCSLSVSERGQGSLRIKASRLVFPPGRILMSGKYNGGTLSSLQSSAALF